MARRRAAQLREEVLSAERRGIYLFVDAINTGDYRLVRRLLAKSPHARRKARAILEAGDWDIEPSVQGELEHVVFGWGRLYED